MTPRVLLTSHRLHDPATAPCRSQGGRAALLMDVRRPMWVARVAATPKGWQLTGNNKSQGHFDAVVIAHNGKCANRLAAPSGAPLVAQQLMRLKLNSIWAVMVALQEPLEAPNGLEGAFVTGQPAKHLSWVANNTAKLGLRHPGHPGLQCWTLLSTETYGRENKVPQEAVPQEVAERVQRDMLAALMSALGRPTAELPRPAAYKCQLWGAALPVNSPGVPCILDPVARMGVCGDWLHDPAAGGAAASMQAAALSGLALAERLAALRGADAEAAAKLAVGLHEQFVPLSNPDIGGFPGDKAAGTLAEAPTGAAPGGRGGGRQGRRQGSGCRGRAPLFWCKPARQVAGPLHPVVPA
ncbi:hypothetical protein MNEG_14594 [Monoraphidium neglectum]|uniref:Amine oxidase domain-containing protein n=1 Tax=Monoraphidium neglectum TaxID=145388 RepID=A0A0D2KBU0_9CHLO|nr:hypothetical protein MNEG_14594 [Monoraphidium neglectum]KIY93368.1 hypothetical protein MNEG_14594 [Monoraphidium neglectum]|eukprot:XP_013892388.1 hypothetical protein MNEG_14594 [Monoraphidium neglectum]